MYVLEQFARNKKNYSQKVLRYDVTFSLFPTKCSRMGYVCAATCFDRIEKSPIVRHMKRQTKSKIKKQKKMPYYYKYLRKKCKICKKPCATVLQKQPYLWKLHRKFAIFP